MTSLTLLLPQMMTMRVPQTCLLGWTKSGGYGTCLLVVTSASLSSHLSLQQSGLWLSHTTNQLQTQLNAHPYCSRTHYHCIPKISLHPTNWNWTKKKKKNSGDQMHQRTGSEGAPRYKNTNVSDYMCITV